MNLWEISTQRLNTSKLVTGLIVWHLRTDRITTTTRKWKKNTTQKMKKKNTPKWEKKSTQKWKHPKKHGNKSPKQWKQYKKNRKHGKKMEKHHPKNGNRSTKKWKNIPKKIWTQIQIKHHTKKTQSHLTGAGVRFEYNLRGQKLGGGKRLGCTTVVSLGR